MPINREINQSEVWCAYCIEGKQKGYCSARHPSGMCCTREKGHRGPHLACGGARHHGIEEWGADEEVKVKPERKKRSQKVPDLGIIL